MIAVQPIYYTHRIEEWQQLGIALGLEQREYQRGSNIEFSGDGALTVLQADPHKRPSGDVDLNFSTDDLASWPRRLASQGYATEPQHDAAMGEALCVPDAPFAFTVTQHVPTKPAGSLSLSPIIYTEDFASADLQLAALGLRPRIASDSGIWADYTTPGGGLVALHHPEGSAERIETAMEYDGNLDTLADQLQQAGIEATIVDEAYNRTLRIDTPDGWTMSINGAMEDLYGFHRPHR